MDQKHSHDIEVKTTERVQTSPDEMSVNTGEKQFPHDEETRENVKETIPILNNCDLHSSFFNEEIEEEVRQELEPNVDDQLEEQCFKISCEKCDQCSTIYCSECLEHLCEVHAEAHRTATKTMNHHVQEPTEETVLHRSEQRTRKICSVHNKRFSMLCRTCDNSLICKTCAVTVHRNHNFFFVVDVADSIRKDLTKLMQEASEKVNFVLENISSIDNTIQSIESQCDVEITAIRDTYELLLTRLNERREGLESKLREKCSGKVMNLRKAKEKLQAMVNTSYINSNLLDVSDDFILLDRERETKAKFSLLLCELDERIATYDNNTVRALVDPQSTLDTIERWGGVIDLVPDPDSCVVVGEGITTATVGTQTQFTIELRSSNHMLLNDSEVIVNITGPEITPFKVEKQGEEGIFCVSYTPTMKGEYKLSVMSSGIHICNSPYSVLVGQIQITKTSIFESHIINGEMGDAPGQFDKPYFVIVEKESGDIYVSDYNNNRVQVFDSNLEFKRNFGSKGMAEGQFKNPLGMAFDSKGNIIVCDYSNHRVQMFDRKFQFVRSFGCEGMRNAQFKYPCGVSVDSEDNIYVVDKGNHRVQVFSNQGVFKRTFGGRGMGASQFNFPWDIEVSRDGTLFISDEDNSRIQVLDNQGKYLFHIGEQGAERGQFNQPRSICLFERGEHRYLIVCDRNNHRVQIFNSIDGTFISSFGSHGPQQGEFGEPCGVAVGNNGNIIVSEKGRGQHRLQLFTLR